MSAPPPYPGTQPYPPNQPYPPGQPYPPAPGNIEAKPGYPAGYSQPEHYNQTVPQAQPQTVVVTQAPQVVVTGNCPNCRVGMLREEYNVCGIILAILFFPIGILCCLMMTEKRCSHCGSNF